MLASAQEKGVKSITIDELRVHMNIIAADEFQGRNTPSQGLKIASRYLAVMAEEYGFKSLFPGGSFYQEIPLEISTVSEAKTKLTLTTELSDQIFHFPKAFGISGRSVPEGTYSGDVVFLGYGLNAPEHGWDDYGDIDLTGKIVIMLEGSLPQDHILRQPQNRRILWRRRSYAAREKGAAAVLTVVSEERENNFDQNGYCFDNSERGRFLNDPRDQWRTPSTSPARPFLQAEIRHDVATAILGIPRSDLNSMFARINRGLQVPYKELPDKNITINVKLMKRPGKTQNVVAYIEGSDPVLKNEYIVYGSHPDHLGAREGKSWNGADDNVSGTVAMLEIAQAMILERPKRSVIMVWHTAEEKGLVGAHYFANYCPVPIENISAVINLDMICRNHPDSLYLVASNLLSTELDGAIHKTNEKYNIGLNFDYKYEDPHHPDRFYRRSDHYPYNLFGIPGVWFFCGTTEDYHQITDTIDRVDYNKMLKVTRLSYLAGYEIGNMDEMLKLDVHPEITTRGKHNIPVQLKR